MNCSIECFVTALAYLDRLQQKDLKVGILNVHTARVGGVTAKSLYFVETQVIKMLDWKAKVTVEEFRSMCELLFSDKRWLLLRSAQKGYLASSELRRSSSESITASTTTGDSLSDEDLHPNGTMPLELQHVSTRLTQATIYMIMVAAALSTAVARATAGNYQLFKPTWSTEDSLRRSRMLTQPAGAKPRASRLIAVPIAVACSLCGYVISRCNCLLHRMFQKYRPVAPLPVAFALQALVTASLGALVFHVTGLRGVWGIGAESLQIAMTKTIPLGHLALFAVGKGVALVLGMAVRCPADLLEPVLITGGFVGGAIGSLLPQDSELLEHGTVMPCIIFGMVGLFASCFRFSLTPIVRRPKARWPKDKQVRP
eukprot:g18860.t1